jgi:hypothetical protein
LLAAAGYAAEIGRMSLLPGNIQPLTTGAAAGFYFLSHNKSNQFFGLCILIDEVLLIIRTQNSNSQLFPLSYQSR